MIFRAGACCHGSDYLQGCTELHQPHIAVPAPTGCWCFQSAHLPVHAELPLLPACCLVSVPLFCTNKEPLTSTKHFPLLCSFAEVCNSIGCSFPSPGPFTSQPEPGYFSVHGLVWKCKACVYASSVTGTPVPNSWGFTWGSVLKGCVLFTVC